MPSPTIIEGKGINSVPHETVAGRPRDNRIDEAVIEAARELLEEVGYSGLTLTGVAARAGTSVPAIRRRWPGKTHLVHDVVFPDDMAIPPRNPDATVDDEIIAILDSCAELCLDPGRLRAMTGLFSDTAADEELQREVSGRLRSLTWADVAERLRLAGEREGRVIDVDPSAFIEVAWGATMTAVLLRGPDALDARWRESMRAMLAAGLES